MQLVLNPGTLLYRQEIESCEDEYFHFSGNGYVLLFSGIASSVKRMGWDKIKEIRRPEELLELWDKEKVVDFSPDSEYETIGSEIFPGKRYVVYGAGETAPAAIRHIAEAGALCSALIDGNPDKCGTSLMGIEIHSPEYLRTNRDDFDAVLIASTRYYSEIRNNLYSLGFGKEELCWWL